MRKYGYCQYRREGIMMKKKVLTMVLAVAILTTFFVQPASATYQPNLPSLYQTFNDYFTFGVFQSMSSYFGGGDTQNMLQRHYLSWSPSNEFKPQYLFGTSQSAAAYTAAVNATYSSDEERAAAIDRANRTVMLASTSSQETFLNNVRNANKTRGPNDQIKVKCHTLLWHNMTPEAFFHDGFSTSNGYASPDVMLDRIDSYIGAVFQRFASYSDVIYSWDVVNEAIDDFTGYIRNENDYQPSNWGRIFKRLDETGDQRLFDESVYIRKAFESARKYERQLGLNWTLVYNDFFDSDKSYEPKRTATVKMLEPIYEAGNIDAVGMQGRNSTALSLDLFKETFRMYSTVCNQIQFTESDTRSDLYPNPNYDPNDIHANYYLPDGSVNPNWNRNDTHSPLLVQIPGWQASWANQTTYQRAQADWLADYFDFLLENSMGNGGKIVMYAVDGLNDGSTFNSNKGATMFMQADSVGNTANTAKMSYYAVIGSKARFELKKILNNAPQDSSKDNYTADSWNRYDAARQAAAGILNARIYDMNGVNDVYSAARALTDSVAGLTDTTVALSDIKVNGSSLSGFAPGVHEYNMTTPVGAVPQVSATAADTASQVTIVQAAELPGKAVITVVSSDGSKQSTYTVNFNVDITLSSLKVDGTQLSGFSPDNYTYNVVIPYEARHEVTATPNDPGVTVNITQAADVPGQASVEVSTGSVKTTYTINFSYDFTLKSLLVDGLQLSGFSPGAYAYNGKLPEGRATIPQVSAVPNDSSAPVSITQAAAVPGQAKITVGSGSSQLVYTVNFGYDFNGNDDFDSPTLNTSLWHWVNEDPSTWSLTSNPGYMTISPRTGDIYGTSTDAKNILLQNAPGNWTIETKLVCSIRPHAAYQQGGLIAYQDMDNYIKLEWEATGSSSSIIQVCREVNGADTATSINGNVVGSNNTLWLRMVKSGNSYTSYYSTDGTNFTAVGTSYTLAFKNVQAGLIAINGSGTSTDLDVKFDYFRNNAPIYVLIGYDKTALNASINTAQALNESDYTAASWANMQAALSDAVAKRDDPNAAQSDIDAANDSLQAAINGLRFAISGINPTFVTTAAGIPPELPSVVTTVYPNGEFSQANVTWDGINPLSYAQAGNFTVQGSVSGTSIKATANVTVTNTAASAITGPVSVSGAVYFDMTYGLTGVQKISAQDVTVGYDKNLFDFVSAEPVNSMSVIQEVYNDTDAGTVRFIIASLGPENAISGAADVLHIKFKSKAPGPGTIEVKSAILGNWLGNVIYAAGAGATVVVDADKTQLAAVINTAQGIYDGAAEGISNGQYPAGTKDRILKPAIAGAQAVLDAIATTDEVAQAIADLNAAVNRFRSLVITPATGDINNIPGYDMGDLGLVAYYYGTKAGDPVWDVIKRADINGDGEIGLYELAFIARRIVG